MNQKSQFELLKSRRFKPYFMAQFLGAFNDNLFKNALLIIVAYGGTRSLQEISVINNIASGLFILPFFIFAMVAGQMADALDKATIIRRLKFTELLLALCAVPALLTHNIEWMLIVLAGFGLQSAFFAPAKYSILPQHLHPSEVVGGNAMVQMGTFVAILAGTLIGGLMSAQVDLLPYLAGLIVLVAVVGAFYGRKVPPAPPFRERPAKWNWNVVAVAIKSTRDIRRFRGVLLAILCVSWFWFLGSVILTQLPGFTKTELGGDASVVSVLLALFSVGIGVGSLLCERVSAGRIEVGLIPMGALGMAVFGWQFATAEVPLSETLVSATAFFASAPGVWVSVHVLLVGTFGGLYIVPLMAFIQASTPEAKRGRALALNSLFNAMFMVLAAVFSIVVLGVFELEIRTLLALTALANIVVLLVMLRKVPTYFLRLVMWVLAQLNYRLNVSGARNIPVQGPVLLVANHVTFVDWLFLGAACSRPIRFLMDKDYYDIKLFTPVLKMAGAIPVSPRFKDPEAYEYAMREMVDTLKRGEVLLVFPEGKLTRSGNMNEFQRGFEKVLSEAPASVVPVALHGLWGSFFSRRWGKAMTRPFKRIYSKVGVEFGAPHHPDSVSSKSMRLEIQSMLDKGMPK